MIADLVEQQTTTTGTGAYTVSGSVTGRRTFASALATNDLVPYVCTDDAGGFECGLGTWDEVTLTLARTSVLSSSNAGAAVNWTAGTRRLYVSPHAATLPLATGRHVVNALAAPTANDDAGDGFAVGSTWQVAGSGALYYCINPAAAAAIWSRIPMPDAGGVTQMAGLLNVGQTWNDYPGLGVGGGGATDNATYWDYADAALVAMSARTTNATPATMVNGARTGIFIMSTGVATLTGTVHAVDAAAGDVATWRVEAVIKRSTAGTVTIAAGATPTSLYGDAALATAACAIVVSGSNVQVQVTGIAAKTLVWGASLAFGTAFHST